MNKNIVIPKQSFTEYMSEKRLVDRWLVLKIGLVGMFAGIALATVFFLRAIIP